MRSIRVQNVNSASRRKETACPSKDSNGSNLYPLFWPTAVGCRVTDSYPLDCLAIYVAGLRCQKFNAKIKIYVGIFIRIRFTLRNSMICRYRPTRSAVRLFEVNCFWPTAKNDDILCDEINAEVCTRSRAFRLWSLLT